MKLAIGERIILLNLLPPEGDLTTIKIVRKLRESLSFNEDELEEYNIQVLDGGQISWNSTAEAEIEIRAKARSMIVRALHELDEKGKVSERHLSLFEKFELGEDEDAVPIAEAA